MRRFRNIWVALVALLWLPAMAHCQLESLTGLELLRCTDPMQAAHDRGGDCGDCCTFEKNQFRPEQDQPVVTPPAPLSSILIALAAAARADLLNLQANPAPPRPAAPPPWQVQWRFLVRTALPVRAPSLPSS